MPNISLPGGVLEWLGPALLGLAALLLVLGFVKWLGARSRPGGGRSGANERRLAVLDQITLDDKRRLVLIRRDEVQHLVILGGANELLVESGIGAARHAVAGPELTASRLPAPPASVPERVAAAERPPAAPQPVHPAERIATPGPVASPPREASPPTAREVPPRQTAPMAVPTPRPAPAEPRAAPPAAPMPPAPVAERPAPPRPAPPEMPVPYVAAPRAALDDALPEMPAHAVPVSVFESGEEEDVPQAAASDRAELDMSMLLEAVTAAEAAPADDRTESQPAADTARAGGRQPAAGEPLLAVKVDPQFAAMSERLEEALRRPFERAAPAAPPVHAGEPSNARPAPEVLPPSAAERASDPRSDDIEAEMASILGRAPAR